MPARKDIHKILVFGSGPIVIGQACEFDYSGNQALSALKEEGYSVILLNPNPATVMTTPDMADCIYMDPLEVDYVEELIKTEKPDAVLPTMGGQTALNLTITLDKQNIFEKYQVEILGAKISSIQLAEDRGQFKKLMTSIGLDSPHSVLTSNVEMGLEFAKQQGFPLIVRPSYTLGGRGGSIVNKFEDLTSVIKRAVDESPVHEALIEESLIGWQEFEMEVMRDKNDNAIVVCSIENVDPMGIHTGDSITVAPIQTLSDKIYQRMRTASLNILRSVGVDCGGSNVQFAYNPDTDRMLVIEMNPRVSRSSALASKATGFPIARCSAKLAVGYTLDEIINEITGKTVSSFEPSLDYVAVKVPRFEKEKLPVGQLGTQMKSIGESLAIGRTFTEALNKAIRACEFGFQGLEDLQELRKEENLNKLQSLDPQRIFIAYTEIKHSLRQNTLEYQSGNISGEDYSTCTTTVEDLRVISQYTGYSTWFLYQLMQLASIELELENINGLDSKIIHTGLLLNAKRHGISDKRIAQLIGRSRNDKNISKTKTPTIFVPKTQNTSAADIRSLRKIANITPCFHFVDSCSGEFEAETPYFYSSWGEINEAEPLNTNAVIILGSGPNRIGQGLEFDACCTLASLAYRKVGTPTILINSNPETVSTDFNVSSRLYLEPLVFEDVLEIMNFEKTNKIIVQFAGQTGINMLEELSANGAEIIGTSPQSIAIAEDRKQFAELLQKLNLQQPDNCSATDIAQVQACCKEIGYPVLLRPSFVLGGRSMVIIFNNEQLQQYLQQNVEIGPKKPILIDQFIEDAFEYDVDAISDGQSVYIAGIMEHIESAGIHSGDSACVFPAFKTSRQIEEKIIDATVRIALELSIIGFLNIQFAFKNNTLYVLEVNPRASRTVPFISKTSSVNLIESVVRIWQGENLQQQGFVEPNSNFGIGHCTLGWAIKEAMFSFDRFLDADPLLGPEMKSTGETIGIGNTFGEAFAKASRAAGTALPTSGHIFVSVNDMDKHSVLPIVQDLLELGFKISASKGTAMYLQNFDIPVHTIAKHFEAEPNILKCIESKDIDLIINTPLGSYSQAGDEILRIYSLRYKIPYTTTISAASAAVEGIRYLRKNKLRIQKIPKFKNSIQLARY